MFNSNLVDLIYNMQDDGGATLKDFKPITYKTGYQVAKDGFKTREADEALDAIRSMKGNCGIWYKDGIYYIDNSKRVSTKKLAMNIGKANKQLTVLRWKDMKCLEVR